MKRSMGAREALSAVQWLLRQLLAAVAALLAGQARPQSLEGRLALVTGAGSGLGRQLALQLSKLGCRVICVDKDLQMASGTAELINKQTFPGVAAAHACDASDRAAALRLSREVLRRHGAVQLLLLAEAPRRARDDDDDDACRHLSAQFWVALGFVPAMVARGEGRVLAVCSEGTPDDAASSHSVATASLIEALSEELRETNVTLTCAYRYQLTSQQLQQRIPELSDECVAAEMLAALRRGQSSVVVPTRTLFWHSVLRPLHMGVGSRHGVLQLTTSPSSRLAGATSDTAGIAVKY